MSYWDVQAIDLNSRLKKYSWNVFREYFFNHDYFVNI